MKTGKESPAYCVGLEKQVKLIATYGNRYARREMKSILGYLARQTRQNVNASAVKIGTSARR